MPWHNPGGPRNGRDHTQRRGSHVDHIPFKKSPLAGMPYHAISRDVVKDVQRAQSSRTRGLNEKAVSTHRLTPRTAHRHGVGPAGHRGGGGGSPGRAVGPVTNTHLKNDRPWSAGSRPGRMHAGATSTSAPHCRPGQLAMAAPARPENVAVELDEELRRVDSLLMAESARCQALEDQLTLLREDMHLERAANNDLRGELRGACQQENSLSNQCSSAFETIGRMGTQKEFLEEDHQQLLHEVGVLRASEERLARQVRRLIDENEELRRYWEDGYSDLKQQRTASYTPELVEQARHRGELARAQRRDQMLGGQLSNVTQLLAESQRGHFSQLGRLVGTVGSLQGELGYTQQQNQKYLRLLQGDATGIGTEA